ncbi:DUF3617 domain-containing protein [Aidingimonas halophila]|uniref:DUF3617 family protein n=1 Tax=Aidingimonas halophila TaxID=574349 RepID=A0A1H3EQI6_9GAMM|nr:DUF3617 family protein [Aidingimonas halophila]GHC31528.1 hypothetical protein GCM10008094_25070 [Aidingimonas halophila]SDX80875.1 Protein of unknown function [Aidingimonas halophila]
MRRFLGYVAIVSLVGTTSVLAEQEPANLEPGEWEFSSETQVKGDMQIPDQSDTQRQCLTQEEIDEASIIMVDDQDECELVDMDSRSDGMTYRLECQGEGADATISGDMQFMGDRAEGTMDVESMTPAGEMLMKTRIEGRRVGDC